MNSSDSRMDGICDVDLGPCTPTATIKASASEIQVQVTASFETETLGFNFEGAPDSFVGRVRLNDTRTERSQAPWAVLLDSPPTEDGIWWSSTGEVIDVALVQKTRLEVKFDLNLVDPEGVGEGVRTVSGVVTAPIFVTCYQSNGSLDENFQSEFCRPFEAYHQFE